MPLKKDSKKTCNNVKRKTESKTTPINSRQRNKKETVAARFPQIEEVAPARILHKQQIANINNLAIKISKALLEISAKNEATTESHIQS